MAGIIAAGLVLMLYARFVLQSPFFVARRALRGRGPGPDRVSP
jgi:hypothetical protein